VNEDRLADFNDALRDPGVRAIITTRGGKGVYRIAHALDFAAARNNPKPLVGYSDITILHLALWWECRIASFHGPHGGWRHDYFGDDAAERLRRALMEPEPVVSSPLLRLRLTGCRILPLPALFAAEHRV
jgi:muramoyltetrapeptide carboxypeptidase